MDLRGKILGNYRIEQLLAKGRIGDVYQADDISMQRDVAVKVIHPQFTRQPGFREPFPREVSATAQIDHPGLVRVLDFGQHKDQFYVVTEYIPGANLRELMDELIRQREWISLNDAARMIEQLCQTIEYAHEHDAFGWDLNPTNLMIKPEPTTGLPFRVVLTDLRLGKLAETSGNNLEGPPWSAPAYLSPEQVLGKAPDARSDVYSLGVLLYELVEGILPFPTQTASEALQPHTRQSTPAPHFIRPNLPVEVKRVILKALEKEPGNRYASAVELETALAVGMSESTQIVELERAQDGNLLQRYQESIGASRSRPSTRLMNEYPADKTELQSAFVTGPAEVSPTYQISIEVVLAGRPPQIFTLPGEVITIGREKGSDLILDDPKVSRRHTQVTQDGSNYYVIDLNSANGTYLDHTRLQPGTRTIWRPHQELRIGGASLRLMSQVQGGTVVESYNVGPRSARVGGDPLVVTVTPQQISVEPGGSVTATLSVLNQNSTEEYFSISPTGIPNDWVEDLPSYVQLMPEEQKVLAFTIRVPRTPQSRAGRHSITLTVTNQKDLNQSVQFKIALTIATYLEFKAEIEPARLRPEEIGRVTITNVGNVQETFAVQFTDPYGNLVFQPPQLEIRIPEARSAFMEFRAREKQVRFVGGEQSYPFSAQVSLPNGESQTLHSDLLSRGFIPVWVLPTVLLLCLFLTGSAAALWYYTQRSITLTVIASGSGTVTSSPSGINSCSATCSFDFRNNANVALVAAPIAPATFGGWSGGGCSGTALTCDLKLSEDQTVTAIFNPPGNQTLIVNTTGTGTGTVTSSPEGINNCSITCPFAFPENSTVTLTANPISPSTFGGWSGEGCSGTGTCTVTMSTVRSVIATFNLAGKKTLTITRSGTGTGTVTSSPAGIDCGSACTFDFADNTPVTLTANATSPSTFGGWSGACSGTGNCTVTMNAAQNVTAIFNGPGDQKLTVTVNNGTGANGKVTSSPAGIDCGSICSANFPFDRDVILTALPSSFTFVGWGGDCSAFGTSLTCSVRMSVARNVTATFKVPDSQPPTTTISGQPQNPSNSRTATFNFFGTSSGSGALTFECKLDASNFEVCASPKTYNDLPDGFHIFQVRAKDAAGNPDPSPESFGWTIAASPTNTPTSTPTNTPTSTPTNTVAPPANAKLDLTKTNGTNLVTKGGTTIYSLTITNSGNAASTGTITIVDVLPNGLAIANGQVTLAGTNAANWSCTAASNVITCTSTTAITQNGNSVFSFTVNVSATASGTLRNAAQVGGGGDPTNPNPPTTTTVGQCTVPNTPNKGCATDSDTVN